MKWAVCMAVLSVVLAAPATASAPTLNSLQRQVTQLRAALLSETTNRVAIDNRNFDYATCYHAQDLDTINLVWHVLNADLAYQGFQAQPDLPRYDDGGSCGRVGITRIR